MSNNNRGQNRGRPYYMMKQSGCINCQSDTIWCFSSIGSRLTVPHRMSITQKILTQRNWSMMLMIFQVLFAICKLCFSIVRKSKLPILFNVILMLSCFIGLLGNIYFSVIGLILYLLGAIAMMISVSVAAGITAKFNGDEEGVYIWGLYAPFIIDVLIVLWQAYFIIPVTLWYLRIERQIELQEEEEKKKKKAAEAAAAAQANPAANNPLAQNNNNNVVQAQNRPVVAGSQVNTRAQSVRNQNNTNNNEINIFISQNDERRGLKHNEMDEDKLCIICAVKDKEGAFYPCGHVCTCVSCGDKFKNSFCPMCRKVIVDFVKLYNV